MKEIAGWVGKWTFAIAVIGLLAVVCQPSPPSDNWRLQQRDVVDYTPLPRSGMYGP